ncbi:hypothetical protein EKI60_01410 [Candidatus Saccharibacteria bacterium]|nr:MAG: hypothetical protein EKI60_01410 [Candidatus Saccharibacteria bacterium]
MTDVVQPTLFDALPEPRLMEPDELTTLERMEVMRQDYGFMPTTRDELNAAIGLVGFETTPGGTARHLNEILLHQKRAVTNDPAQAVRSVTAEYDGFARRAQSDHQGLINLQGDVRELMNPRVSIGEDAGSNSALRQLVRFMDLDAYTLTKGEVWPGFDPLKKAARVRGKQGARMIVDRYSASEMDEEVETHVRDVLAATTVGQTRVLVDRAVADQARRLDFWVSKLRESRNHGIARPIADRALAHLGEAE